MVSHEPEPPKPTTTEYLSANEPMTIDVMHKYKSDKRHLFGELDSEDSPTKLSCKSPLKKPRMTEINNSSPSKIGKHDQSAMNQNNQKEFKQDSGRNYCSDTTKNNQNAAMKKSESGQFKNPWVHSQIDPQGQTILGSSYVPLTKKDFNMPESVLIEDHQVHFGGDAKAGEDKNAGHKVEKKITKEGKALRKGSKSKSRSKSKKGGKGSKSRSKSKKALRKGSKSRSKSKKGRSKSKKGAKGLKSRSKSKIGDMKKGKKGKKGMKGKKKHEIEIEIEECAPQLKVIPLMIANADDTIKNDVAKADQSALVNHSDTPARDSPIAESPMQEEPSPPANLKEEITEKFYKETMEVHMSGYYSFMGQPNPFKNDNLNIGKDGMIKHQLGAATEFGTSITSGKFNFEDDSFNMKIEFEKGPDIIYQGHIDKEKEVLTGWWIILLDSPELKAQLEAVYEKDFGQCDELFGTFEFKCQIGDMYKFKDHDSKSMLKNYIDYMSAKKTTEAPANMFPDYQEISPLGKKKSSQYLDVPKETFEKVLEPEYSTKIVSLKGIYSMDDVEYPIIIKDLMIDYFGMIYQKKYTSKIFGDYLVKGSISFRKHIIDLTCKFDGGIRFKMKGNIDTETNFVKGVWSMPLQDEKIRKLATQRLQIPFLQCKDWHDGVFSLNANWNALFKWHDDNVGYVLQNYRKGISAQPKTRRGSAVHSKLAENPSDRKILVDKKKWELEHGPQSPKRLVRRKILSKWDDADEQVQEK